MEVVNYKTKKRKKTDKSKHIIISNTHEGIISTDDYKQAQILLKSKSNPYYIEHENLFKSVLFCSGCGRGIHIAYHKLYDNRLSAYYKCTHHFKHLDECIQSIMF